ncbi:PA3496 family putative envelope integrity protein [Shewanella surugensis]|uniref:Uncharacterized protein n=1 Tax=Shewanella surugensis TaxID=212020 RepID=A0ABT0LK17_9GAMM|nr:hypothetical protein [Shewanella surugensis]MCL1128068.1 hypothetical protein [Shewanella surugensis]
MKKREFVTQPKKSDKPSRKASNPEAMKTRRRIEDIEEQRELKAALEL